MCCFGAAQGRVHHHIGARRLTARKHRLAAVSPQSALRAALGTTGDPGNGSDGNRSRSGCIPLTPAAVGEVT